MCLFCYIALASRLGFSFSEFVFKGSNDIDQVVDFVIFFAESKTDLSLVHEFGVFDAVLQSSYKIIILSFELLNVALQLLCILE